MEIIIKTWEERAIGTQPPAFQTSWEVLKAQRGEAGETRQVLSAYEQSLVLTRHFHPCFKDREMEEQRVEVSCSGTPSYQAWIHTHVSYLDH